MKMKLIFCEKKARKPLVSLEKNIAEHFCSAMMKVETNFDTNAPLADLLLKDIPSVKRYTSRRSLYPTQKALRGRNLPVVGRAQVRPFR